MATAEILLTEDQRLEFTQIPQNISEYEIAKYYTFSTYDIDIINKHRRDYNRLGFAVQLALLRNPGWSLISINNIPENVLDYISEQIKVSPKELELNIAGLHPNRIRQLSRLGSKYEPFSLRRFEEKKRYSILALYLYELSQNLINKVIE